MRQFSRSSWWRQLHFLIICEETLNLGNQYCLACKGNRDDDSSYKPRHLLRVGCRTLISKESKLDPAVASLGLR